MHRDHANTTPLRLLFCGSFDLSGLLFVRHGCRHLFGIARDRIAATSASPTRHLFLNQLLVCFVCVVYFCFFHVQIRVGAGIAATVAVRVGAWNFGWRLPVWEVNDYK